MCEELKPVASEKVSTQKMGGFERHRKPIYMKGEEKKGTWVQIVRKNSFNLCGKNYGPFNDFCLVESEMRSSARVRVSRGYGDVWEHRLRETWTVNSKKCGFGPESH